MLLPLLLQAQAATWKTCEGTSETSIKSNVTEFRLEGEDYGLTFAELIAEKRT